MSTVRYMPNVPMPTAQVLDKAKEAGLTSCVVIGFSDGGEYVSSSETRIQDALWMIDRARHFLMKLADETEGF